MRLGFVFAFNIFELFHSLQDASMSRRRARAPNLFDELAKLDQRLFVFDFVAILPALDLIA
jgi:hypothetical protein